jgi:hypothetical protein
VAAFAAAAGGATRALAALGPVGIVAGAALGATVVGVKAFTDTVDAFVARGRELASMNGQLAFATASADVTRFRSDKREADTLGPQLAKLIENQAKANEIFQVIMLPIKDFILGKLNMSIELGLQGVLAVVENAAAIQMILNFVFAPGALAMGAARELIDMKKLAVEIRDLLRGGPKIDVLTEWVNAMRDFKGPAAPGPRPGLGGVIRLP